MSTTTDMSAVPSPRFGRGGYLRRAMSWLWRRWNEAEFDVPKRSSWPLALRRVRVWVAALFLLQLGAFMWWSSVLYDRFALTWDFSTRTQAAYLIAHGNLNPFSTGFSYPFFHDHGEYEMLLIGEIYRLWEHPLLLLWLQDLCIVIAGWIAFEWICEIAARYEARDGSLKLTVALAVLGALLLLGTPWNAWAISFDVHFEVAWGSLFAIAAARDLLRGRRRAWVWMLLTIASGDLGATYILLIGLSLAIYGRRWWKHGVALVLVGLFWLWFLGAIHDNQAVGQGLYVAVLGASARSGKSASILAQGAAMLRHPLRVIDALWGSHTDIWANLVSAGLLGIFWPPITLVVVAVLIEGALTSSVEFTHPGFQYVIVTMMMSVGTVAVLVALARTRLFAYTRRIVILVALLAVNLVIWAVVWFPQVPKTWLDVSPAAATTLKRVLTEVRPSDQVVVSQGLMGRFAARTYIYQLFGARTAVPIKTRRVWFIFAPNTGTEASTPAELEGDIGQIAAEPNVKLVASENGVWAFLWTAPRRTHTLNLKGAVSGIPAWVVSGKAGTVIRWGPVSDWHIAPNGSTGYMIEGDYWRLMPGNFTASISVRGGGGADVQVWDDTTGSLLAQQQVPSTSTTETIPVVFDLARLHKQKMYTGWGIWRTQVQPPPTGEVIEVRVWVRRDEQAPSVYRLAVARTDGQ